MLNNLPRNGICHRLDKNTSGILLVAKNLETMDFFQKQFADKLTRKKYLVLAVGDLKENEEELKFSLDSAK